MSKWFEYDPVTGVHEENVVDPEDATRVIVRKTQNVQGLLDRNAYLRNTGATDIGIKKGLWHYCSIPLVVQYELLKKYGLNIQNKNHTDRIFQVINRDFPYLKTTDKIHSRTPTSSRAKTKAQKPGQSSASTLPSKTLIVPAR